MKSLNDYTNTLFTPIFEKYGVFFAFSNAQFEEKSVKGVKYVSDSGMIIPKENFKDVREELAKASQDAIALDKKENGQYKIIRRELFNYECFYTYEIDDAVDAVADYGYTQSDVLEVFNKVRTTEDVDG